MAAVTEISSKVTEFAGDYKVAVVRVTGSTATSQTLTIDELDSVVAVSASLLSAPTAACAFADVRPNTTAATNVLDCALYKSDLVSTTTQTTSDYMVVAVGY